MFLHFCRLAGAAVLPSAVSMPAWAQSVRLLGDFRDWSAYSASEGADRLCFALSKPKDVTPRPDNFSDAFLYITNRPGEGTLNEFNLVAGFTFAADSPASVSISGQAFELFTQQDAAWLLDPARADNLASAIRAGSTLVIDATTDRGIKIVQTFSLSGATAASRAIEGC